jgi:hypothetical protein
MSRILAKWRTVGVAIAILKLFAIPLIPSSGDLRSHALATSRAGLVPTIWWIVGDTDTERAQAPVDLLTSGSRVIRQG